MPPTLTNPDSSSARAPAPSPSPAVKKPFHFGKLNGKHPRPGRPLQRPVGVERRIHKGSTCMGATKNACRASPWPQTATWPKTPTGTTSSSSSGDRKRSGGVIGNVIFFVFLVSWVASIGKAYYELTTNDELWPAPFNWENKIWALFFEGMTFKEFMHPDVMHPGRETTLDLSVFNTWLEARGPNWPIIGTTSYVLMLILGPMFMASRERPFFHKPLLTLWSMFLAAFSTVGALRVVPPILKSFIEEGGPYTTLCGLAPEDSEATSDVWDAAYHAQNARNHSFKPLVFLWVFLFILSKLPELTDTVFLVMGKNKVRFLHWYHHITVLWFSWYCWQWNGLAGPVFAAMNLTVHSLMYTWYALAAADGFFCQRGMLKASAFSMFITSIQIIQMIFGSFICFYLVTKDWDPEVPIKDQCANGPFLTQSGAGMYASYLVLFVHLFLTAYVWKKAKRKTN